MNSVWQFRHTPLPAGYAELYTARNNIAIGGDKCINSIYDLWLSHFLQVEFGIQSPELFIFL
jgi:hypothetical protein